MPYGAHETMEMHEILMEKINAITHFNLYAKEARNPQLLDMIIRHQQEEIRSYNEIVSFTRETHRFVPIPPNTNIQGISHQQIQYGLNQPPQFAPQSDARLNDAEIAVAMLLCHKNGARNCTWATLECADPNLRRCLMNSAATCVNQAYEVFVFMNEQGLYQVPTLDSRTAETFMQSYQPSNGALEAQYGMQSMSNAGYGGSSAYGGAGYMAPNMAGSAGGGLNVGSAQSVLYGAGREGSSAGNPGGMPYMYGSQSNTGSMPQ